MNTKFLSSITTVDRLVSIPGILTTSSFFFIPKRDHDIIPSSSCNWKKKDISNTFLKWDWFHSLAARITLCHWGSEIERLLNPSHSFFYRKLSLIILILPPIFWHLNTYFFNWQLLCLQKNHYLPTRGNVICFCTFIWAFFFKQTKKSFSRMQKLIGVQRSFLQK